MFDRPQIYLHTGHSGPSHVTVTKTEKRAPTDESVKLLREMEAAAKDQVLAAVRMENTPVDGVLHVMEDVMNDQTRLACVFKVNGKRLEARHEAMRGTKPADMAMGLRDAIAEVIANELTTSVLAACDALKPNPRHYA